MAIHVRESFLDDSEDGRLDFFRHPGKNVGMKAERDLELAALGKAVHVPVERGADGADGRRYLTVILTVRL